MPKPRSLSRRLVVIPIVILLAGLLAMVGAILLNAQSRITAEIDSGMELGKTLVATALRNVADASSPELAFEHLARDLPQVRHVRFELVPFDATLLRGEHLRIGQEAPRARPWLARLLAPPPEQVVFPVRVNGALLGEIRLHSNSANEIAEIVQEVELLAGALASLCLLIVGALLWVVRRSLRPIQSLAEGFDRLERGDYRPIPPIGIAELQRAGKQFNHLAQSLHRVTEDNHRLIDKLESVQEQERKELAAELHDAIGPALFGIRAEAAGIIRSVPRNEPAAAPVLRSARMIAELTDGIQKLNYRMLDRLRPLVLEQMGLAEALHRLVASLPSQYPEIAWSLNIPAAFDEPSEALSLMLYRVAQESVTNVIRHAGASAVEIRLRRDAGNISLCVRDNGHGLPADFRYGFGLLGMSERMRRFGASLTIANAKQGGVLLEISAPRQNQADITEDAYAHPVD